MVLLNLLGDMPFCLMKNLQNCACDENPSESDMACIGSREDSSIDIAYFIM